MGLIFFKEKSFVYLRDLNGRDFVKHKDYNI